MKRRVTEIRSLHHRKWGNQSTGKNLSRISLVLQWILAWFLSQIVLHWMTIYIHMNFWCLFRYMILCRNEWRVRRGQRDGEGDENFRERKMVWRRKKSERERETDGKEGGNGFLRVLGHLQSFSLSWWSLKNHHGNIKMNDLRGDLCTISRLQY